MKYLLLILAVMVLIWLLRGSRRVPPSEARKPSRGADAQTMVVCAQCGVHLPRGEALPGRGGVFCGEAHRAEYEKQHPQG